MATIPYIIENREVQMLKIVYRYILKNIKYSIGAIIGIAVSTMLMFSMLQISDSYMTSFKSFINSGAPQDFYVVDLSYEELNSINEHFRSMGEDAPDKYLSTIYVGDMYYDNSKSSVIIGYEGDLGYFKKTSPVIGKYPESENEICVEESYIALNPDLRIGDALTLDFIMTDEDDTTIDVIRTFTVCGVIKDVVDDGNFFYTNLKTAADIYADNNMNCSKSNAITVEAEEGNYNEDKAYLAIMAIRSVAVDGSVENTRHFNYEQLILNEEKIANFDDKGSFESVSLAVFLLSLIIAVCLTIFVYNAIRLSFVRKIDVFGTMRCIGLSNRQLIGFILTEQLILVSIGALIGMAAGVLLNLAIAEKIMSALFSTAAVMKIDQNIKTYILTFLLTLFSAFIACIKLIIKIKKTNPINIRSFSTSNIILSDETKIFTSKILLFNIALRNLKRNSEKSVIQTVTLVVSFILCLVISNFFAIIGFNSIKDAADFSDYTIQANIANVTGNQRCFSEEDLALLKSMEHIDKVYTEKCLDKYKWDKTDSQLQILLYDDDLLQKFAEINNIYYDPSKAFSVLISESESADSELSIQQIDNHSVFTIQPDVILNTASKLNYAVYSQQNTLIINEKLAESKGITDDGYCAFLVKTDYSLSEITDINFSAETVYVTDLHEGRSDAEAQLLGMIIIAGYIVIATIVLSFMIISNTIKENMASKKAEYGIMRAMGLSQKNLWTVACHENLILTLVAVSISIPLSLIVNFYLSLILFDEIRISIIAYLLGIFEFIGLIELFAYLIVRSGSHDSIVDMIYER